MTLCLNGWRWHNGTAYMQIHSRQSVDTIEAWFIVIYGYIARSLGYYEKICQTGVVNLTGNDMSVPFEGEDVLKDCKDAFDTDTNMVSF